MTREQRAEELTNLYLGGDISRQEWTAEMLALFRGLRETA